jgi:hypothetical protein
MACLFLTIFLFGSVLATEPAPPFRTENVVLITWDGFRWQELFGGADETLMHKLTGGVRNEQALRERYWRDSAEDRRRVLLPFLWNTVAKEGQIFGEPKRAAAARITNGKKFSYPGYHELLCGFADERIDSNAGRNNPNPSVLEFLNNKPAYKGRVAAFCSWDIFRYILRADQSGLHVHSGWDPINDPPLTPRQQLLNETLDKLPRYWADNTFDAVILSAAREHLRRHKPRVLYLALGETDEWGHGRRYDLYLDAAHNADRALAELWTELQKMPQYAGKTSIILTTDHGRGLTRVDWTDHGEKVPGAEYVWMAVLGPDTPPLGVRERVNATQAQIAATVAHLLGEDFARTDPRIAPPLNGVRREAK